MNPPHVACTSYPPDSPDEFWPFPDAWRTEAVLGLAFGIRADEAFDRMPILADALEEAGCDELLVLNHCRLGEHHRPDCWILDQLDSVDDLPEYDEPSELLTVEVTSFQKIERI